MTDLGFPSNSQTIIYSDGTYGIIFETASCAYNCASMDVYNNSPTCQDEAMCSQYGYYTASGSALVIFLIAFLVVLVAFGGKHGHSRLCGGHHGGHH